MSSSFDQLNSTVDQWLSNGDGAGGCVCVVLDTCDAALIERLGAGAAPLVHLKLPSTKLPPEQLPALLVIDPPSWQLRQTSINVALEAHAQQSPPIICGWLWSSMSVAALARSIASSLLRVAEPQNRYVFRHHDPRVRSCLRALLGDAWLKTLLPQPHEWLWLRADGSVELQTSAPAASAALLHTGQPEISSVSASRVQQVIERCAEINQALAFARREGWRFVDTAYTNADHALSACEQLGFSGNADRLAFVLHALMLTPRFYNHPPIAEVLHSARKNATTYIEAAARIGPALWHEAATPIA
jgi:hypothetical protein